MRDYYKKHFHKEDDDCKKKSKNKFIFILLGAVFFIYFVSQMKNTNKDYKNVKLISSKLTTKFAQLRKEEKLKLLGKQDSAEYIVSAELINESSSNTFVIQAFIETKDTIYTKQNKLKLDSNVATKTNIQFPKMKRLTGKRKYKVGIVK